MSVRSMCLYMHTQGPAGEHIKLLLMQGVAAVAKCLQIIKLFKNSTSFSSVFLKTVLLADLFLPKRTVYVLVPKGSNIYYFFFALC